MADPQAAALADVAQWVAAGLRLQEPTLVGLAHEVAAALAQARGDRAGSRRAARAARAAFAEVHAAYHVARMDAWLARSAQAAGDSAAFHDRWHLATAAANAGGFRLPCGTDALAAGVTRPTSSTARYALRLGLVAAEHGLGVVVHVAEGWVERGGHRVDLGPGSVTLRVLLAIVGAGRSGVTAAALSEAVWGPDAPAGRLRFQLHRLRAALGEGDAPLVAQRRGRHLVYRWNAAIPVRLRGRSARPQ